MLRPDAPPLAMVAEVDALCAHVRRDASSLYGRLLQENVLDVLRGSFPLFSEKLGEEGLGAAAARFLAEHPATRPQFHELATEFVEFTQRHMALPALLLSLIEYEWAMLAVEIDPAVVADGQSGDRPLAAAVNLIMNPTTRLVVLPAALLSSEEPDGEARCACAIYRTHKHRVVTRPLSYADCLMIDALRGADGIDPDALPGLALPHVSEIEVRQWVADGLACDLLQIVTKGTSS